MSIFRKVIMFDNEKEEQEYLDSFPQIYRISANTKLRIFKQDRYTCVICQNSPSFNENCSLEVDHIIQFSKSKNSRDNNLQTLCKSCHKGKHKNEKNSR